MIDNIYNPEYVKTLFDKMSQSYERMNYITSFGFSIRWRKQFLKNIEKSSEKIKIIDLLSGMGETWGPTMKRFPNAELTALDFSEGMLNYATKKNTKYFKSNIHILHQDILKNQLPKNHFDIVICSFGLKTFNEEQLIILANVVEQILKPGGQFSFIEVSKPKNKLLQKLYGLYLGKIIPILGRILLGNPEEYKMLWKYTLQFENSNKAFEIFKSSGLKTTYQIYFFGCASGFNGRKQISINH